MAVAEVGRRAGAVALVSALVVIGQRSPIYSAFALIVTLCSLCVIFALLGSPFIAALQVIVYAGAIMVLFLFVLMLLNVKSEEDAPARGGRTLRGRGRWRSSRCSCCRRAPCCCAPRPEPAPAFDASTRTHGRDPLLAALPLRLRGHLDPDPGGAGGGDRARQEGRCRWTTRPSCSTPLLLSLVLFGLGTLGVFLRRNVITVLMCIELMLNAVNLAFVAFSRARRARSTGRCWSSS